MREQDAEDHCNFDGSCRILFADDGVGFKSVRPVRALADLGIGRAHSTQHRVAGRFRAVHHFWALCWCVRTVWFRFTVHQVQDGPTHIPYCIAELSVKFSIYSMESSSHVRWKRLVSCDAENYANFLINTYSYRCNGQPCHTNFWS